ncbi:MAG: 30S ribosomal protein S2 [Candidatus Buchananbacteria bacterium]|nr:30S ribosomal protein S2 [Candidatus Buchananbacteria bacterium]
MTKIPTVLELLKSGAHFGHQVSRWHPKMKPYIFGVRNGVHIIDLEKTVKKLEEVQDFIEQIVSKNGTILFLGTKKQVQDVLKREAKRCETPYITEKWIGGFLTNFSVVIKLTQKYNNLVKKRDSGELSKYTKKEQLDFEREIDKLESDIFGVKDMTKLPDAIFVWDVKKEKTAVKEAKVKKIPIIGICDTNTNPEGIDYIIPTNDDATKTIDLIITYIADCIIDAKKKTKTKEPALKEGNDKENKNK